MPDIELYGILSRRRVMEVLDDAPYAKQLTVVWNASQATDLVLNPTPFIRVCATKHFDRLGDLIARLRPLNIDIEIMMLDDFIPAGA